MSPGHRGGAAGVDHPARTDAELLAGRRLRDHLGGHLADAGKSGRLGDFAGRLDAGEIGEVDRAVRLILGVL
jgi:hypothetical protein